MSSATEGLTLPEEYNRDEAMDDLRLVMHEVKTHGDRFGVEAAYQRLAAYVEQSEREKARLERMVDVLCESAGSVGQPPSAGRRPQYDDFTRDWREWAEAEAEVEHDG